YEYISRKYCPLCAADVHRRQKAAYMRELRRKTREKHEAVQELCTAQQRELDLLRDLIQQQRENIRNLEEELQCQR
ncbi:MAG: hypothetical protein J6Y26_04430, partial [Lachnospiraceae bacterium]|nr:hypothetical protein [Lachnospiraceae bacterium]